MGEFCPDQKSLCAAPFRSFRFVSSGPGPGPEIDFSFSGVGWGGPRLHRPRGGLPAPRSAPGPALCTGPRAEPTEGTHPKDGKHCKIHSAACRDPALAPGLGGRPLELKRTETSCAQTFLVGTEFSHIIFIYFSYNYIYIYFFFLPPHPPQKNISNYIYII